MSYLRITNLTTTLMAHDPYDLQKELSLPRIEPTTSRSHRSTTDNYKKFKLVTNFHIQQEKGVELKLLRCRHSSQTRESTSEELQLNLIGRSHLRYLAHDTSRPRPPCSSSTKS